MRGAQERDGADEMQVVHFVSVTAALAERSFASSASLSASFLPLASW